LQALLGEDWSQNFTWPQSQVSDLLAVINISNEVNAHAMSTQLHPLGKSIYSLPFGQQRRRKSF